MRPNDRVELRCRNQSGRLVPAWRLIVLALALAAGHASKTGGRHGDGTMDSFLTPHLHGLLLFCYCRWMAVLRRIRFVRLVGDFVSTGWRRVRSLVQIFGDERCDL